MHRKSRRAALMAVALAVPALALAGCGGGADTGDDVVDGGAPATTAAGTPAAGTPFDVADALISLDEMPTGWSQMQSDPDSGAAACGPPSAFAEAEAVERRTYGEGGGLPVLDIQAGSFAPGKADASFDARAAILADCQSYVNDGDTFTVSPLSFPKLGDESVAFLQQFEDDGLNYGVVSVSVRVGNGIGALNYFDFGAPDAAVAERYARTITRRLRSAQLPQSNEAASR